LMAGVAIDVDHVSRHFDLAGEQIWALRDVSLNIAPGEFMAIIGRSGSGKTTLLNLIAGLDRPNEGTVAIDGQLLTNFSDHQFTELRRKRIGFIFQSFGLLPLLSAQENVELAMRIAGASRRDRINRSREVLDMMGLGKRANHRPYELSGGEQQRVAIARAIANRPALILADEPTGELDSVTAVSIFRLLRDVARSEGITILTSTHDRTVIELATRVEELADGSLRSSGHRDLLAYTAERGGRHILSSSETPVSQGADGAANGRPVAGAGPRVSTQDRTVASERSLEPAHSVDQSAWSPPGKHDPTAAPPEPPSHSAFETPGQAEPGGSHQDETAADDMHRWAPPDRRGS